MFSPHLVIIYIWAHFGRQTNSRTDFPHMSGTSLVSRGVGVLATDVSATSIDPTQGALAVANNLRIASLSIAAYEYVTSYVSPTPYSDFFAAQLPHHYPC